MESKIFVFLESQSFEFSGDETSFFGSYLDYHIILNFSARCSTLDIEVWDNEKGEELTLTSSFIDKVFALLEERLGEHYAEMKAMEDQRNHEEYLWNHR